MFSIVRVFGLSPMYAPCVHMQDNIIESEVKLRANETKRQKNENLSCTGARYKAIKCCRVRALPLFVFPHRAMNEDEVSFSLSSSLFFGFIFLFIASTRVTNTQVEKYEGNERLLLLP